VIKRKSTAICVYDVEHNAELTRHAYTLGVKPYICNKVLNEANRKELQKHG
jgi:predicted peroxiredoxin